VGDYIDDMLGLLVEQYKQDWKSKLNSY
jgi:hypothetical protein